MKRTLFLVLSCMLGNHVYSSLPKTAAKVDILAQTADGKPKVLTADFIAQSSWIQNQMSINSRVGRNLKDRASALAIPLKLKQLDTMEELLRKQNEKKLANKEVYFSIEDLAPLELEGLAELIRNTHYLGIKVLLDAAAEEFLSLIKARPVGEFVRDPQFISKYGFSEEILRLLGGARVLDEADINTVLSLLYTDVQGDQPVRSLCLSPSNRYLLTVSGLGEEGRSCAIYDTRTNQKVLSLRGTSEVFEAGSFCAGPDIVLQTDKSVRLLSPFGENPYVDVRDEAPFLQLNDDRLVYHLNPSNTSKIWGSCVSPDYMWLAAGVNDAILVRSLVDKESILLREDVFNKDLDSGAYILFTPDSKGIVEMRKNGSIRFWNIEYRTPIAFAMNHKSPIIKYVVTRNGILLTLDETGKICEWNLALTDLGKLLKEYSYEVKGIKAALAFNASGKRLALACDEGGAKIYDVENNQFEDGSLVCSDELVEGCYHPSGRPILATTTKDHNLIIWNPETYEQLKKFSIGITGNGLSFSSSGSFIVRPFLDGTIRLYQYASSEFENYLRGKITLPQALLLKVLINQEGVTTASSSPVVGSLINDNNPVVGSLINDNNNVEDIVSLSEVLSSEHLQEVMKSLDRGFLHAFHIVDEGVHLTVGEVLYSSKKSKDVVAQSPMDTINDPKPEAIRGMAKATMRNSNGFTIFHVMAQQKRLDWFRSANAKGSKFKPFVDMGCNRGWTPLHIACAEGHIEIVNVLRVQFQAKTDVLTNLGSLPLHIAAQYGQVEVVECLLALPGAEAWVNAVNAEGCTPLHCAVSGGQKDVIQVLVQKGAAIRRKNKAGKTAYDLAVANGAAQELQALVQVPVLSAAEQASINVSLRNAVLSEANLPNVIKALDNGADPNFKVMTNQGNVSLVVAAMLLIEDHDKAINIIPILRHLIEQGLIINDSKTGHVLLNCFSVREIKDFVRSYLKK